VEGRIAFTRRLKGAADAVHWSDCGDYYLLVMPTMVLVHSAATNACELEIDMGTRVNHASFAPGGPEGGWRVLTVCDNKTLCVHESGATGRPALQLPQQHGRPKSVSCRQGADGNYYTVVVTSSGVMMAFDDVLYEADCTDADDAMCALFTIGAEPRLTCLATWNPAAGEVDEEEAAQKKKKKRSKGGKSGVASPSNKGKDKGKVEVDDEVEEPAPPMEGQRKQKKNAGNGKGKKSKKDTPVKAADEADKKKKKKNKGVSFSKKNRN